eukprot:4255453-Prorocentrum_lima.AAC.1
MSNGQEWTLVYYPNKNDSQGSSLEAARGATKCFNKKDLPDESKAPICSCCKNQHDASWQ